VKKALLAGLAVLALIGGAQGPPAPVDFDHAFGRPAAGPGLRPGGIAGVPEIPARRVKTVVIIPTDPIGHASAERDAEVRAELHTRR
jgi:hypothetical protein